MPVATQERPSSLGVLVLGAILAYTAWSHLTTLDHSYLPGWDEAVHAAVAGNLVKHPGTPTLFDQPFVPYSKFNWQANHVWLHMPPLPFWQAALSVGLSGRSFFALRFPSLLLFMLTIGLVYALGIRLHSEVAGLLGALLLAASPFAWLQVQGYHFGDMTDVSLAFWLVACVLSLERALASGRKRWAAVAGGLLGMAILSKSALALAPAGAVVVIWLLPRLRFRLAGRVRWTLPALTVGLGLALPLTWRIIASIRWPEVFAHEQKALWSHVTTSYEGHGRPWDTVVNDLIANLVTPPWVLVVLAGTLMVGLLAYRTRRPGHLLHILWILGTILPLAFVRTKVPALLFGVFPALALAAGVLLDRVVRKTPGPWISAAAVTPVIYLLLMPEVPADFFRFAAGITPDMAVWPHLPMLTGFFVAAGLLFSGLGALARRMDAAWPATTGALIVRFAVLIALAASLARLAATREGFGVLAGYNPVARTALAMRDHLPERATILIEGVTHGRQRPDLTVSFLTGHPAHIVGRPALARTLQKARTIGAPFLVTRIRRTAEPVARPSPGAGFFVYPLADDVPAPDTSVPDTVLAEHPQGPDLISVEISSSRTGAGEPLHVLAIWRTKGPSSAWGTQVVFAPVGGEPPVAPYPLEDDFPAGMEGTTLHTLAPSGLLWGVRPLGTDLAAPRLFRRDEIVADDFMSWVPAHLPAGTYELRLTLLRHGRPETPAGPVRWPHIEVVP